jgi:small acid-soluble spore protein A (major alpha-type SASP)
MARGGNKIVVPQARQALEQLKYETASELGIPNYQQAYKGDLPSKVNGSVGGGMVKKMIQAYEQSVANSTRV